MRECDRGQSELVGFALLFSFIILTIVLVGATGFVGLDNAQDHQRTTNAEQAFIALAENVDDVTRRGAPSRATEIGLDDASLSAEDTETITVTVGSESAENTTVIETDPIVYDSGSGTKLVYSSGALVRQDGQHSVMFRQPSFHVTDDLAHLPIVATSSSGDGPVGGTSAVSVETRSREREVLVARDGTANVSVTIEITSDRAESWHRYLDTETATECDPLAGDTVTCEIETRRVYLSVERVDVRFG